MTDSRLGSWIGSSRWRSSTPASGAVRRGGRALLLLAVAASCDPLGAQAFPDLLTIRPAFPSTRDHLVLQIVGISATEPVFAPPVVAGGRILVQGQAPPCPPQTICNLDSWAAKLEVGPLGEGTYQVEVRIGDFLHTLETVDVHAPGLRTALVFGETARTAMATRPGPGGEPTYAEAVQLSDEAGYFWFGQSGRPDATLRLVDGCHANSFYWVFVTGATRFPFTVTVRDQRLCPDLADGFCFPPRTYEHRRPGGLSVVDLRAFPCVVP